MMIIQKYFTFGLMLDNVLEKNWSDRECTGVMWKYDNSRKKKQYKTKLWLVVRARVLGGTFNRIPEPEFFFLNLRVSGGGGENSGAGREAA